MIRKAFANTFEKDQSHYLIIIDLISSTIRAIIAKYSETVERASLMNTESFFEMLKKKTMPKKSIL